MLTGYEHIDTSTDSKLREKALRFVGWLKMQTKSVKSPVIESVFECSGVQVRAMVSWLRTLGDPDLSRIASDEDGYRWVNDYSQIIETRKHLRERRSKMQQVEDGLARAFGRNPGQVELL